jgi:hypothetical protein
MCAYHNFSYDASGCFNQSLLTTRVTTKTITTHNGCFANGYWIKDNNQLITLPRLQKGKAWNFSYQCNKTNDEFYLSISNKGRQVVMLNSTITSVDLPIGTADAYLHTYCGGASNKQCSVNASTRGFEGY